jgi:hypothetical protein
LTRYLELGDYLLTTTTTTGPRARPASSRAPISGSATTGNLPRLGFTAEDVAEGGSDRLIDAVIPHGSAG